MSVPAFSSYFLAPILMICKYCLANSQTCLLMSSILFFRKGFFITAIFTSTAGFCSALAPNYAVLLFFRFFVGLGLGGGPVLSSWLLEFIPAPRRGTWMSLFSAFWTVGTLLEASLAWVYSINNIIPPKLFLIFTNKCVIMMQPSNSIYNLLLENEKILTGKCLSAWCIEISLLRQLHY